jgi:hypothetical protein
MSADKSDNISAREYAEVRFNLLTETLREHRATNSEALLALADATKLAALAVKAAADASATAQDLRYQQRFEAQSDALAAAFASQQQAMTVAFTVAEKAVAAALAAADRAVSKSELAADKRFEALNELRQMLNDMVASLLPRVEAMQLFKALEDKIGAAMMRIKTAEDRLNLTTGEDTGDRRTKSDIRLLIGLGITLVLAALTVIGFIVNNNKPDPRPQVMIEQVPQVATPPARGQK